MSDFQEPLIENAAPTKRRRVIGKTRSDKGKKRVAARTARELAMLYFAGLDIAGKQRFIEDCTLILKFCDPAFNEHVPDESVVR